MKTKSILELNNGAIINKANYELERIIENINDINTDPTKAREMTIKIKFKADETRQQIYASATVTSKIQNTKAITTTLFNIDRTNPDTGEHLKYLQENTPVPSGQINIFGDVQPEGNKYLLGNQDTNKN